MHTSPRPLQVHNGNPNDRSETVDQLELRVGQTNHPAKSHRQRDLADEALGLPGIEARHREILWWLSAHAGDDGVAQVSLKVLAVKLRRTYTNVCADVRDLVAAGLVKARPSRVRPRHREYFLPSMAAPIRVVRE